MPPPSGILIAQRKEFYFLGTAPFTLAPAASAAVKAMLRSVICPVPENFSRIRSCRRGTKGRFTRWRSCVTAQLPTVSHAPPS